MISLMSNESIKYSEYKQLMNRVAGWLLKNGKQYKKREQYEYYGHTGTVKAVENNIQSNYKPNTFVDYPWGARYIEAIITDNISLSFLPDYVTSKNGIQYTKTVYVDMVRRVTGYESKNKKTPAIVYVYDPANSTFTNKGLNPYITVQGCKGMGQCTPYYCACNSLQQALYRLTGIIVSESTLASVMGTTTSGTSHNGINTGVAWFNKKYGKNVKIQWKNFKDLGTNDTERWKTLQNHIDDGAVFTHILYRNKWGHYEVPQTINTSTVTVLNSLGNKCSTNSYCGYIETRNKSTMKQYMSGISQPSIAILTL